MITMKDLDESASFLAQLKAAEPGPVTIVNTFIVPEGAYEAVLDVWKKDSKVMKTAKGFISAQLHKGVCGASTLVNIAVWESAVDLLDAFMSPSFQSLLAEYPDGSVAYPVLVQKIAVENICVA